MHDRNVIVISNNQKVLIENVDFISGISNEGMLFYGERSGCFKASKIIDGNITEEKVIFDKYDQMNLVYINSTYKEVMFNVEKGQYFYDVDNRKLTKISDEKLIVLQTDTSVNHRAVPINHTNNRAFNNLFYNHEFNGVLHIDSLKDPFYITDIESLSGAERSVYKIDSVGNPRKLYSTNKNEVSFCISANGKTVYVKDNKNCDVYKVTNSKTERIFDGMGHEAAQIFYITDNSDIYYFDQENNLFYQSGSQNENNQKIVQLKEEIQYFYNEDILNAAFDYKSDTLYFIENKTLYFSKSGGTPQEIEKIDQIDYIWLEANHNDVFLFTANQISEDLRSEIKTHKKRVRYAFCRSIY